MQTSNSRRSNLAPPRGSRCNREPPPCVFTCRGCLDASLVDHPNPKEDDMTRKLSTLFAAALLTGITTATAVFAAEGTSTPQPPRTQVVTAPMSPDQMAQMTTMTTDRSNAPTVPDKEHPHFRKTHSAGVGREQTPATNG